MLDTVSGLALVPRALTSIRALIKEISSAGQVVNSQLSGPTGSTDLPVALTWSPYVYFGVTYLASGTSPTLIFWRVEDNPTQSENSNNIHTTF